MGDGFFGLGASFSFLEKEQAEVGLCPTLLAPRYAGGYRSMLRAYFSTFKVALIRFLVYVKVYSFVEL